MGFLQNKRIVITGVASNRSIAWGCAQAMRREGAQIALTYQNDKLKSRWRSLRPNWERTSPCPST